MQAAVAYLRVSTIEQAAGVSLDAQLTRVTAYAALMGLTIVSVFREEGVSGSLPLAQRPAGAELLALLAQKTGPRHVIGLKLDRLFRSAVDALSQAEAWEKAGVSMHLVDHGGMPINAGTPTGKLFLTMLAGFAEYERAVIRERMCMGRNARKAQGKVYCKAPLGFEATPDRRFVEVESEAATVRQIRAWRAEGLSLREIATRLRESGTPTKRGGKWEPATVNYILKNSIVKEKPV